MQGGSTNFGQGGSHGQDRARTWLFVFVVVLSILTAALVILRFQHRQGEVTTTIDQPKNEVVSEFVTEAAAK